MKLIQTTKSILVLFLVAFLYSCTSVVDNKGDAMSSLVVIQENKATKSQEVIVQDIDPIKVALMVPLTGKYAEIGVGIVNAFQLSLHEHGYYFVEVAVYDTGDGKDVKALAKKAVKANTDVVVGPLFSKSLQEIKGIIPSNIPVITFSNDLRVIQEMSNAYTVSPNPLIDMERSISYVMQNKRVRRVALLVPENSYGDVVELAVNKSLDSKEGVELVKTIRYNPSKSHFNKEIGKLVTKPREEGEDFSTVDVDTVIIGDFSKRVFLLTSQFHLHDIDVSSLNIIGTMQWDDMMKMRDSVLENAHYSSLNKRNVNAFKYKYRKNFKEDVPEFVEIFAFVSYDIANMVFSFVDYDKENYSYTFNLNKENLLGYESSNAVIGNFKFHPQRFAIRSLNVKRVFADGSKVVVDRNEELNYVNIAEQDESEEDYSYQESLKELVEESATQNKDDDN